jgi:hypothetical protein
MLFVLSKAIATPPRGRQWVRQVVKRLEERSAKDKRVRQQLAAITAALRQESV